MMKKFHRRSHILTGPRRGVDGRAFQPQRAAWSKAVVCCGNDVEFSMGVDWGLAVKG